MSQIEHSWFPSGDVCFLRDLLEKLTGKYYFMSVDQGNTEMLDMSSAMKKYPRTPHLEGSNIQEGDSDESERVPFDFVHDKYLVVEEKVDGSCTGISFPDGDTMKFQSRGHYLAGGPREKQYDLFKSWAWQHYADLRRAFGKRYIMYGEWMYAKHTIWYDRLPSFFMEFDVYDKKREVFLSTAARNVLLRGLRSFLQSVRVIQAGAFDTLQDLVALVGSSAFINHDEAVRRAEFLQACDFAVTKHELELSRTDLGVTMEGLYIKHEVRDKVIGRYKWVRADFVQRVNESDTHWHGRPIVRNKLWNEK